MQRAIIGTAGFEAKFRENIDPWNYLHQTGRFQAVAFDRDLR